MKTNQRRRWQKRNNRRASVSVALVVALLASMATMAAFYLTRAESDFFGAVDYMGKTRSLILAESAVEETIASLDLVDDWSTLELPDRHVIPSRARKKGRYWSEVHNNPSDPGGQQDNDGFLFVRGYGNADQTGHITAVEVLVWNPKLDASAMPSGAAIGVCGPDLISAIGGHATISGFDHDLPREGCAGRSCDPPRSVCGFDAAGVAFALEEGQIQPTGASTVEGAPPLEVNAPLLQGPAGACAKAELLSRHLALLPGTTDLVTGDIRGRASYGSYTEPVILRVVAGSDVRLAGNAEGTGILLVEDGATMVVQGTFKWTGVILTSPGSTLDLRGTSNIVGTVFTLGNPGENSASVLVGGDATFSYSTAAMNFSESAFPTIRLSWKEML